MKLIRLIVLNCMIHNVKVTARHVRGIHNELSDFLSRDKIVEFKNLANARNLQMSDYPTPVPREIWPVEKLWFSD